MTDRKTAACPVDGCGADIPVRTDLRAGEYPCRCHHRLLELSWTTYLQGGREPMLRDTGRRPE